MTGELERRVWAYKDMAWCKRNGATNGLVEKPRHKDKKKRREEED